MSKYRSFQQIKQQLLLTKQEALLIRLLFYKTSQDQERELYRNLVFDNEKQSFLLLLARLAKRSNFAYAPGELIPRLQGLLRYHGVNNKLVLQPAVTLLDHLEQLPVMLYGHSAMYGYYDRENPRLMGIGDLWAAPGSADDILRCAKNAGFQIQTASSLAVNLKNAQGNVNLHKLVLLHADPQIWERSKQILLQNRPVLIPDCIDTLILLLRSELRWWCIQPKHTSNIKWYYDCACLLQHPDFPGWDTLAARAAQLGSAETVRVMLTLFDQSLPGWIPNGFLDKLPQCNEKALALALQYGAIEKQYETEKTGSSLKKAVWWVPMICTKYHYLNSEISYADPPVSLLRTLRRHWGVTSLTQLPVLFWNRVKNKQRKEKPQL